MYMDEKPTPRAKFYLHAFYYEAKHSKGFQLMAILLALFFGLVEGVEWFNSDFAQNMRHTIANSIPWWGWVMLLLAVLLFGTLHFSYRYYVTAFERAKLICELGVYIGEAQVLKGLVHDEIARQESIPKDRIESWSKTVAFFLFNNLSEGHRDEFLKDTTEEIPDTPHSCEEWLRIRQLKLNYIINELARLPRRRRLASDTEVLQIQ